MRLAPLIGIQVAALLLIIAEAYAFFEWVVPIGALPHSLAEYTGLALLKIGLTFGLGVLWLAVVIGLTRLYVGSRLGRRTPTPPS